MSPPVHARRVFIGVWRQESGEELRPSTSGYAAQRCAMHCAARPNPDELDREDLICSIRQLFGDGKERERDEAIDALVRELGYQRAGIKVHEELDTVYVYSNVRLNSMTTYF